MHCDLVFTWWQRTVCRPDLSLGETRGATWAASGDCGDSESYRVQFPSELACQVSSPMVSVSLEPGQQALGS